MATQAEIAAQIAEIDAILTTGERRISSDGQTVEYDFEALERRRGALVRDLGAAAEQPMIRRVLFVSTRGY